MKQLRKGQPPERPERAEFHNQFARSFADPRFDQVREAIQALEDVAWQSYCERRKAALRAK